MSARAAPGPLRGVYEAFLGEPLRNGHIRLQGLTPVTRHAAIAGLAAVAAMVASLMATDLWRRGTLILSGRDFGLPTLLPAALLPVTLIAMALAWSLVATGASLCGWPVRVAVALLFVMLNAALSRPLAVTVAGLSNVGPRLVVAAFWAVPVLVVLSGTPRLRRALVPAAVVALAVFYAGHLWIHVGEARRGLPVTFPELLDQSVREVQAFTLPLVFISVLALVGLAHSVAAAGAAAAWRLPAWAARLGLCLLLGIKLAALCWNGLDQWTSYAARRPWAVARVVAALCLLAALAWVFRRGATPRGSLDRRAVGLSVLLSLPLLSIFVTSSTALLLTLQFRRTGPAAWIRANFPYDGVVRYGNLVVWLPVAAAGLVLVTLGARRHSDLGAFLALTGGWVTLHSLGDTFGVDTGFRISALDLALTFAVAGFTAVRWRRLDAATCVRAAALVGFAWLVSTRGDFVTITTGVLAAPAAVALAAGVAYTILADSSFTRTDGRRIPRAARTLLWIGYLLASVTLTNHLLASRAWTFTEAAAARGFLLLGIPFAAWLAVHRPFSPADVGSSPTEPLPVRSGPRL